MAMAAIIHYLIHFYCISFAFGPIYMPMNQSTQRPGQENIYKNRNEDEAEKEKEKKWIEKVPAFVYFSLSAGDKATEAPENRIKSNTKHLQ